MEVAHVTGTSPCTRLIVRHAELRHALVGFGSTVRGVSGSRRLLRRIADVAAGPVFVTTAAIQALTRDGYDLTRHPISMLSLGELDWIQITNFVLTGLLMTAFAVGTRRVLHPGRAGTWGPVLFAVLGLGMIIGGVFVTDPWLTPGWGSPSVSRSRPRPAGTRGCTTSHPRRR